VIGYTQLGLGLIPSISRITFSPILSTRVLKPYMASMQKGAFSPDVNLRKNKIYYYAAFFHQ